MPRSKSAIPITSKIRLEFYLPERADVRRYAITKEWLISELTHVRGGSSRIEGISGTYLDSRNMMTDDTITLLWCDLNLRWERTAHRREAIQYARGLKQFLIHNLREEEEIGCSSVKSVTSWLDLASPGGAKCL